jgi:hypothetical protein
MKKLILRLTGLIAESLERIIGPDARFVLVIWSDGDREPMVSVSNETRIENARNMLRASAGTIDEIEEVEIFAQHDTAGHA